MKKFLLIILTVLLVGCTSSNVDTSDEEDNLTVSQIVTDYDYEVVGTDTNIHLDGEYDIETTTYDEVISVSITPTKEDTTAYLVNYYEPIEGSLEEIVSSMCEGLNTSYLILDDKTAYFAYEEVTSDKYYVGETYFYLTEDNNYVSLIYHYPTVSINIEGTDLYLNTIDKELDYSVNILSTNPFIDLEPLSFNTIDVYNKDNVYVVEDEDKIVQITFNGEEKDALLFKAIMETMHH